MDVQNIDKRKTKLTKYNGLRIPPNIRTAEKHLNSTIVGNPIKGNKSCPCCLKPTKETFNLSKDGTSVTKFGSTIPLYFHFSKFIRGYFFIILTGSLYHIYRSAKLNYEFLLNEGENPPISLTLSFIFTEKFIEKKTEEVDKLALSTMWIDIITNIVIIGYSLYFVYSQKKCIER